MQQQQKSNSSQDHPVIFGEILYDCFPDGKRVLGGAPFNVAWHLHGFGLQPLMITRIGEDAMGTEAFETMQAWHMNTQGVQRDPTHPTGKVQVTIENGAPHFDIPLNQAYDQIETSAALAALQHTPPALLYHGTLALRHAQSQQAWQTLVEQLNVPIFLDVNLRAPWWQKDLLEHVLKTATWVKLNEDEMAIIEPRFKTYVERDLILSTHDRIIGDEDMLEAACQRYGLTMLVVTLGEKGALLKKPGEPLVKTATPKVATIVDSVGAGDAFSAVMLSGLIHNWPPATILERAVVFAAALCQIRGATTRDNLLYQQTLEQWSQSHE
ncbi:MAG: carbohydrate kinase [Pseudomonadota bacterium]|nr:carbohydrate kinase [Pseudomonadota bacterium]